MMANGIKLGLCDNRQGDRSVGFIRPRNGAGQLASSAVYFSEWQRYGTGQLVPSAAVHFGVDALSIGVCSGLFHWFGTVFRRLERKRERPSNGNAFGCFYGLERVERQNLSTPPKGGYREVSRPRCLFRGSLMADDKEARALWVRQNLPTCAAVAAGFAEVFPEARMTFASENGHVLGKRGPDGVKLSETVVGLLTLKSPKGGR